MMVRFRFSVPVLVAVLILLLMGIIPEDAKSLSLQGANVCPSPQIHRRQKVNRGGCYHYIQQAYKTWCPGLGWILSLFGHRCNKTRQVTVSIPCPTQWEYYREAVCCAGWTRENSWSSGCTSPVCPGGCLNGGQCKRPNQCSCRPGWTGNRCERSKLMHRRRALTYDIMKK